MHITHRENMENRRVKLTICVEQETWEKALAVAYMKNKAFFPVEGFAPGAAPRQALESAYGADVLYQEAVNDTFPEALVSAIAEQKLQIAGTPTLSVVSIGPEGYTFDAVIDLYPEVKLGQYKGLRAKYDSVELSDDDVNAALQSYQRAHMLITEPEVAELGDEVTLDFEGFVDGQPFEGGKGEQYPLLLGSGAFIPGFEEQVVGIRVGEERDLPITFPQLYHPELAGKDAVFHIKAQKIVRHTIQELDDAFAVTQGFTDLHDLRRQVMEEALRLKQMQAQDAFSDALIQQDIDNMEAEIPESMVEGQLQGLVQELERQLAAQGMELDAYLEASGLSRDALREHARENALRGARYELAMMEIARLEGIEIAEEELDSKYAEMSQMYGMDLQQLRAQLPPLRMSHDLKLARARAVVVDNAIRS